MGAFDGKIVLSTCERRPCWVNGRRAIFHRWIDSARPVKPRGHENDPEMEYFQLYCVQGLVEYEDGTLRREWPTEITFADSAAVFGGICWESMEHRRDALPFTFDEDETGCTIEVPFEHVHPSALNLVKRILEEQEQEHILPPVEKMCSNCAHCEDGDPEACERVRYGCRRCTAECYCAGCVDHSKWEPEGTTDGE